MKDNIRYTSDFRIGESSFFFDHVHISSEEQIGLHQQPSWELLFVVTGKGTRVIGDTMKPFSEGEVVLIPPDMPHCWHFNKSFCDKEGKIENITITFTDKLLENISSTFEELKEVIFKIKESNCAISFKGNSLKKLQDKMASMIKENNAERVASFISLLNLVTHPQEAEIVGHPAMEDKKTKKIQSIYLFVMNNYQRNITLSEIAQFSGMEKSSFCIFFKKMSQKSFFTFLTEYRIDASCQMLLKTTKSVSEISFTCGFRDIPYYNRVFKKMKLVTPSEYRNNH